MIRRVDTNSIVCMSSACDLFECCEPVGNCTDFTGCSRTLIHKDVGLCRLPTCKDIECCDVPITCTTMDEQCGDFKPLLSYPQNRRCYSQSRCQESECCPYSPLHLMETYGSEFMLYWALFSCFLFVLWWVTFIAEKYVKKLPSRVNASMLQCGYVMASCVSMTLYAIGLDVVFCILLQKMTNLFEGDQFNFFEYYFWIYLTSLGSCMMINFLFLSLTLRRSEEWVEIRKWYCQHFLFASFFAFLSLFKLDSIRVLYSSLLELKVFHAPFTLPVQNRLRLLGLFGVVFGGILFVSI